MAWGYPGVSKLQMISNGSTAWSTAGAFPVTSPLQQVGILNKLRMIQSGTPTFTAGGGTIAADVMGPYNIYSNLTLISNQQAPVFQTSGYGMYLINCLLEGLEGMGNTPDTATVSGANAADSTYIFNARETSVPGAPANQGWNFFLNLPVAQRVKSLGGDVGMFILQNPNVQLQFSFTPNTSAPTSGAYPIWAASTSPGVAPYTIAAGTTPSVTLTNPQVDLVRYIYEAVQNAEDYPNLEWVSQWLEESPQSAVGGATQINWKKNPVAGLLCRIMGYVYDSSVSNGVRTTNLTAPNAINLTYETNITKFAESGLEAMARQRDRIGHDMPAGSFFYDLLGPDLTLQDVLDTSRVPNIQFQMNFASALGATSSAKILYQTLLPLGIR